MRARLIRMLKNITYKIPYSLGLYEPLTIWKPYKIQPYASSIDSQKLIQFIQLYANIQWGVSIQLHWSDGRYIILKIQI